MQLFEFQKMEIEGVFLITPFSAGDERGKMIKDYSAEVFGREHIIFEPKETLYISSHKNVIRGLHVQRVKEQPKLIRCISGCIFCAAVDIRMESSTCGKWVSAELTEENGQELYVPGGCAVGTLALEDSQFTCKCGENYYGQYEDGVRWDDPDLKVAWPLQLLGGEPVISEKDRKLQGYQSYMKRNKGGI